MIGFSLNPIEDLSDAADTLSDVASSIPGASAIADAISGPVKDFANTAVGRIVFTAIASTLTGGLAPILGPQLMTVAWALPGLARGDDFTNAWIDEFTMRVKETADIVGPEAAGQMASEEMQKVLDYLSQNGIDDPTNFTAAQLARLSDSTEEAAGAVIDGALGYGREFLGWAFDPVTHKRIPNFTPKPSPFLAKGTVQILHALSPSVAAGVAAAGTTHTINVARELGLAPKSSVVSGARGTYAGTAPNANHDTMLFVVGAGAIAALGYWWYANKR